MAQNSWTREQTIVALNLYWKIPYNQISGTSNPQIKEVAAIIGKTPSALAFKLMNLSSLDDERQNKGKLNSSQLDKEIWHEFNKKWGALSQQNALILVRLSGLNIEMLLDKDGAGKQGLNTVRSVKTRINQSEFRSRVLASYNSQCCITGIAFPELLVASHIIPWSKDATQRLNPKNGLCLNALHDRAFDRGLMTITQDFKIKLTSKLPSHFGTTDFFTKYEGMQITLPDRFLPGLEFLQYHEETIFRG